MISQPDPFTLDLATVLSIFNNIGNTRFIIYLLPLQLKCFLDLFISQTISFEKETVLLLNNLNKCHSFHIYCHGTFYNNKKYTHSQAQPRIFFFFFLTPSYITALNIDTSTENTITWCAICKPQVHHDQFGTQMKHSLQCDYLGHPLSKLHSGVQVRGIFLNGPSALFWKSAMFWKGGQRD